MRRQLENNNYDHEAMKRLDLKSYLEVFKPVLSRRQTIAVNVFTRLNRERDYSSISDRCFPMVIKSKHIIDDWEKLNQPIAKEFLLLLVQSIDDAFIDFSLEQLKNG